MISDDREPTTLSPDAEAVVKLACDAVAPMSPAQEQAGLERLRWRVERRPAPSPMRWALRAGLVAAAFCSILVAWSVLRRPALSFSVSGAELLDQGYVRSASGGQATVRFSDGSVVELAGSTRLRVASVDPTGARLAL
jgi:ferric-dicitrate binding protein FerR (iron transport regulator)